MSGNSHSHIHRIVESPGYHVTPKYDLDGLRARRTHKKKEDGGALPLTSMIDMFSILVIYLIMNFSSTGEIFFISKEGIKLPEAKHARPIESLALVTITTNGVLFDAKDVGGKPGNMVSVTDTSDDLPELRRQLQQVRIIQQQITPNQPFKGAVNIQADQNVPLKEIKKVMTALISEGWTGINFAVQGSGRDPSAEAESAE